MAELKTNFPLKAEERKLIEERRLELKVIQVEMDGNQYLWLTTAGHADCLTSLLENEGNRFGLYNEYQKRPFRRSQDRFAKREELSDILTYETVPDLAAPGSMGNVEVPALEGQGYRVLGMGKVRIDVGNKTAEFYGYSMSYQIDLYPRPIFLLKQLNPDWKIDLKD